MTQSSAILVLGHGSRSAEAKRIFERLVDEVKARGRHALVAGGHMSLCEPTLETAAAELVDRGARHIVVAPYFLYEGIHFQEDIPAIIEGLAAKHAGVSFTLARPIGFDPLMADIVLRRVDDALADSRGQR